MANKLVCDECGEGSPPRMHVLHYTITSEGDTLEVDLCDQHDDFLQRLLLKPEEVITIGKREYPTPPKRRKRP